MSSFEKCVRDGKVAVLYSPSFGAGWSTWADEDIAEQSCMDRRLVEALENGGKEAVKQKADEIFAGLSFYTGGARDLEIEWLPVGTIFEIEEYDGNESIHVIGGRSYMTA